MNIICAENEGLIKDKKYKCLVLMSSYNGKKYILEQCDSIMKQKGVEVHLIIRDDGSNYDNIDYLKELKKKYSNNVTIFFESNEGIHKSFLRLIKNNKYNYDFDYVAFSDQDDVWEDDKLIVAISMLKKFDCKFYSCAASLVDEKLNYLGKTTSNKKKYNHYMMTNSKILTPGAQGCTIVLEKSLFNLIREREYPNYYGHDTWITVISYYLNCAIYDPKSHMKYRQHNNSWTGNRSKKIKQLFKEFNFFVLGLKRYKTLSRDLIRIYGDLLNENDVNNLKILAKGKHSIKDRFYLLKLRKFKKYEFLNNFIFKIYILFFIDKK